MVEATDTTALGTPSDTPWISKDRNHLTAFQEQFLFKIYQLRAEGIVYIPISDSDTSFNKVKNILVSNLADRGYTYRLLDESNKYYITYKGIAYVEKFKLHPNELKLFAIFRKKRFSITNWLFKSLLGLHNSTLAVFEIPTPGPIYDITSKQTDIYVAHFFNKYALKLDSWEFFNWYTRDIVTGHESNDFYEPRIKPLDIHALLIRNSSLVIDYPEQIPFIGTFGNPNIRF